jgi:hypothetical protein
VKVDPAFEAISLRAIVIGLLQDRCEAAEAQGSGARFDCAARVQVLRAAPASAEERLVTLARRLELSDFEVLAVALCHAADDDPQVARLVARVQEPVGGSRPLLGMITAILRMPDATPLALASGMAVKSGMLVLGDEHAALPERSVALPIAVAAALGGRHAPPAGIADLVVQPTPLTEDQRARCGREAAWLEDRVVRRGLLIRCASAREAAALAKVTGENLERRPVAMPPEAIAPNAAWLMAADALPCVRLDQGPGDVLTLPSFGHYVGPVLLLAGPEGRVESDFDLHEWTVAMPSEAERTDLWMQAGLDAQTAARASASYRQGAGRIADLGDRARLGHDRMPEWSDLAEAVRTSRNRLDGLARRSHARISREDLVLPAAALADLDLLAARIQHRNRIADGLGPAIAGRYSPGVRALFTGQSGTGKTLAACWLSERTGLPVYRVDQAALTSKWIGETEKNLSVVLDAAQNADVILFFDEADALFGARTDVRDANDRHANAQTNYLLQRIEEYEGVIVLATNSRDRFDPAFVRRLDTILPFPMPDAQARQTLWRVHLGADHALDEADLATLAVAIDLAGGHIRNIVLGAAVRARQDARRIVKADIAAAAADEFGKLGRAAPSLAR